MTRVDARSGLITLRNGELYQHCGVDEETPLPDSFKPLPLSVAQDKEWLDWVKSHAKPGLDEG